MALTDKLTAIANAIRAKDGTSDKMTLAEMPSKIAAIQVGGATEPYIEETYDSNGNLVSATLHGYTKIRNYAFYKCGSIAIESLPDGITSIGNYAFCDCTKLALTSLPSGLTSIGSEAFSNCKKLALTSLPSGLTSISLFAFGTCLSIKSLTFEGKPTSIHSSAFQGCINLTTINVPWAEGEVEGAPWGATSATINYNYTGG